MSVYKAKLSPFYSYDFEISGIRFYGSTKCRGEREAKQFEKARRVEAVEELKKSSRTKHAPMDLNTAFARFWIEVGQEYSGSYRATFWKALCWLEDSLGKHMLLRDIRPRTISDAITARKTEGKLKKGVRVGDLKPATINRTVVEPLRRVMNRARKHWEEPVKEIAWDDFLLEEPKERVRELTSEEEERIFKTMREDYEPLLLFALVTGFRLGECVNLTWSDIDFGDLSISVVGKGDKKDVVPITPDVRDFLWDLRGHHPDKVFTYVAQRDLPKRKLVKGKRYPITREGLKTRWRRAKVSAKLVDYRFHDNRHTAATRFLRATGNVKLAQHFLRHEDVATTMKYAHASRDDLRSALKQVAESRNKSRTKRSMGLKAASNKA
jgi:integrase